MQRPARNVKINGSWSNDDSAWTAGLQVSFIWYGPYWGQILPVSCLTTMHEPMMKQLICN